MSDKFTLSAMERTSALWLKLAAHFEEELKTLRKKNDSDLPELVTWKTRGRIAQLNEILTLGQSPRDGP